jgi:hypothetical protein
MQQREDLPDHLGVRVPVGKYADMVRRGLESGALRPYDPVDLNGATATLSASSSSRRADLAAQLDAFHKDVAAILTPDLANSAHITKSNSRKRTRRCDVDEEQAYALGAVHEEALWQSRVRGEPCFR